MLKEKQVPQRQGSPRLPRRTASLQSFPASTPSPLLLSSSLIQQNRHKLHAPNRIIYFLWTKFSFDNVILLLLFLLELRSVSFEFSGMEADPSNGSFNNETFHIVMDANDDDDSVDNIVIKWNHWKSFEAALDSIWEGNLLCEEISSKVHIYYDHVRSIATEQKIEVTPPIPRVHVQAGISCYDLFMNSIHGTGNYIQTIYTMRVAVRFITIAKIKLNISCTDADELQDDYVLPWYTGIWYSPNYFNSATSKTAYIASKQGPVTSSLDPLFEHPSEVLYCGPYFSTPTALMFEEMQFDARRTALAFVGVSLIRKGHLHSRKMQQFIRDNIYQTGSLRRRFQYHESHSKMLYSYLSSGNQQERFNASTHLLPLISRKEAIELDDAVIHFRCGDLLNTNLTSYGFMTFDGYSRHISPKARTIGVLTQPFGLDDNATNQTDVKLVQQRTLDTATMQQKRRCRTLVMAFVDHLQERHPSAKITVRNDRLETITVAYVRMVLANQSVSAMSTFSLFPILGSFGTGYVLRPKNADPSGWLIHHDYPITKLNQGNVELFDESNLLLGPRAKELWDAYGDDLVLQWFRTGKYSTNTSKDRSRMNPLIQDN